VPAAPYEIASGDGFIRVVYRGRLDFDITNRSVAEAALLGKQAGTYAVMFDFAAADPRGYFAETVKHGEMAAQLGMSTQFRIAFYSPTQFDAIDFMETVARNRGYDARAFKVEEEALKWLKGLA
jgi:hypothetical protein